MCSYIYWYLYISNMLWCILICSKCASKSYKLKLLSHCNITDVDPIFMGCILILKQYWYLVI